MGAGHAPLLAAPYEKRASVNIIAGGGGATAAGGRAQSAAAAGCASARCCCVVRMRASANLARGNLARNLAASRSGLLFFLQARLPAGRRRLFFGGLGSSVVLAWRR